MILLIGVIGIFSLSSCTKSFCTTQDKANQLYAYYGNLYETSVSYDSATNTQKTNRQTLFNTMEMNGYSRLDKKFLNFMGDKVDSFVNTNYTLWTDGTLGKIEDANTAKSVAKNVAIYAGLDTDDNGNKKVADLFTNFDSWYDEAILDSSIGVLYAPSSAYVSVLKNTMTTKVNTLRGCFAPEGGTFTQYESPIYIEGKSWGEAFSEYGFLEGLFVYPFAWIVHQISNINMSNGWMQILAILIITLLARIVTVVSTLLQTKTQARQQQIQPLLNQLAKKYPENQTDMDQRRAYAMETSQLMKKNKIHPFLPLLLMILQFPLFICVWSSLQDSAALAAGNWLGLSLITPVSQCFTSYGTTNGALVGIFIFIAMTIANILSSATSLFFSTWRTKNFGTVSTQMDANGNPVDPNKSMKWMTIIMSVFVIFMGWNLPAGMGIYWLFGSVISIIQSLVMEMVQTRHRHNFAKNTGDGSTLAAVRRSKHHSADGKADKKNKSDKPLWR